MRGELGVSVSTLGTEATLARFGIVVASRSRFMLAGALKVDGIWLLSTFRGAGE